MGFLSLVRHAERDEAIRLEDEKSYEELVKILDEARAEGQHQDLMKSAAEKGKIKNVGSGSSRDAMFTEVIGTFHASPHLLMKL